MGRPGGGVLPRPLACLAVLTLWGCTSVDTEAERQIAEQRPPRPAMIVVHDFAVSPDEVQSGQPWSSARLVQDTARTGAEKAVGHAFADEFAAALVEEIRKLGLPAERANGAGPAERRPGGHRGPLHPLAGDPSAPGIVGFAGGWPDVLADVQLYGTNASGERLSEDLEVSLSAGDHALSAALLPDPTITAGQVATAPALSPQQQAQLATAARQAAGTVAGQLKPYFAGQGGFLASRADREARHDIRGGGEMSEESAAAATRLLDCPRPAAWRSRLDRFRRTRARIAPAATGSLRTASPATATRGRFASR